MKEKIILVLLLSIITLSPVLAALVEDYDIQTTTYASLDTSLKYHISNSDLLNGQQGTLISGGFHPATVPADDSSRVATLTDGTFASNGLTVISADGAEALPDFCASVLEYPFTRPYDISTIQVFAGHDNFGGRAWINVKIEIDQGAGYSTLIENLKTGPYGQPQPNTNMVSVVHLSDDAGPVATNVSKIKFRFFDVSHNSSGTFKAYNDNSAPENNYPNQGTILKEIDVFGFPTPLALSIKTATISLGKTISISASAGIAPYQWSFSTSVSVDSVAIGYISPTSGSSITFYATGTGTADLFCIDNDTPVSIASAHIIVIPTSAPFPESTMKTVIREMPTRIIVPNRMSWELFE